jgi:hypothetical protein
LPSFLRLQRMCFQQYSRPFLEFMSAKLSEYLFPFDSAPKHTLNAFIY